MYIWNNIFFSLAFDSRDHFKNVGGAVYVVDYTAKNKPNILVARLRLSLRFLISRVA